MKNEYLSEEKYQKIKNKLTVFAYIIFIIVILVGIILITNGISRSKSVNKAELEAQIKKEFHRNGFSQTYYKLEDKLDYSENAIFFYIGGTVVIFIGTVISISLLITAKDREITAFKTQQMMPIAQEGINKISPNLGNAAKEIVKGVKDGMED